MVDIGIIVTWLYELFVYYVFGDPLIAGIFGFIMLFAIAFRIGLGLDSVFVLALFSSLIFSVYALTADIILIVVMIIGLAIISLAILKLIGKY